MRQAVQDRALAARAAQDGAVLTRWAEDSSPRVRREVAANQATTAETLGRLATDSDWRTRGAVALHLTTPEQPLIQLLNDPRWEVHSSLIGRLDLSTAVLLAACDSREVWVRRLLAEHDLLPLSVALRLTTDADVEVRKRLAVSTPFVEVRAVLAEDEHRAVRQEAKKYAHRTDHRPADPEHPTLRQTPQNAGDLSSTVAIAAPTPLTPADLAHWSVPRRPSTRWLKSRDPYTPSDEVPPHIIWQWRVIKIIDADLTWANWWQAADYRTLHLVLPLSGRSGDHVSFTPTGQGLQVSGTSSEVSRLYRDAALGDPDSWTRQFHDAFVELLRSIMRATAHHLDIAAPPPLPNLTSASGELA